VVSAAAVDSTSPTTEQPPSKEKQAVSAAVAMNCFKETINPENDPTLDSKNICLKRQIKTLRGYFMIS
jgi:hypothetical protein